MDVQHAPRVGIVVVHWGKLDDTLACLQSLSELDYSARDVVVINNRARETSVGPEVTRRFPGATILETATNLGFAGGNNLGIDLLLRREVDYVLLLNNDTVVAPDVLRRLVTVAEQNPDVGMLGPRIDYFGRPNVIWSAGGTVDRWGWTRHRLVDEELEPRPEDPRDVDYVTGCALLVKRRVVERIGGLDERFFLYFEETEWCARARRAGYRVTYVPSARIWHKIEPDARSRSPVYQYYMTRNRLLYLRCRGANPLTIALVIGQMLRPAASWLVRPKHRDHRADARAIFRGIRDFLIGRFGPAPAEYAETTE